MCFPPPGDSYDVAQQRICGSRKSVCLILQRWHFFFLPYLAVVPSGALYNRQTSHIRRHYGTHSVIALPQMMEYHSNMDERITLANAFQQARTVEEVCADLYRSGANPQDIEKVRQRHFDSIADLAGWNENQPIQTGQSENTLRRTT